MGNVRSIIRTASISESALWSIGAPSIISIRRRRGPLSAAMQILAESTPSAHSSGVISHRRSSTNGTAMGLPESTTTLARFLQPPHSLPLS
jgi:hypothetical protein